MQCLSLLLMLTTSLLAQCSDRPVQRKAEPKSVAQQTPAPADKPRRDECDFSSYAPVGIKHFDSGAVTKRVKPDYPSEAVQRGIQGQFIVKALVNETGDIERACAVEGEGTLKRAAEKAALQWKLKPGYGLAFLRPKTKKNPKNYAELHIVFSFKIDETGGKAITTVKP
jgi:outer membrane biosynthesis protein TonB